MTSSQTHAIRIYAPGGPEAIVFEPVDVPAPGSGEVLIRHTAIGVNFIDIYHRSGVYPLPSMPGILGMEGAGIVEALGEGVSGLQVGDRVAYAGSKPGAYAQKRLIAADSLVSIPDNVPDTIAAAIMLKGMTARYLLKETYPVKAGDWILGHAAAGGVGLILGQWAKSLGAHTIGTVSTPEKAKLAKANGYDHVIVTSEEDFASRVQEITGGKGVAVAYDSVGKDTFLKSLESLGLFGMLVSFGQSSGVVESFNPGLLALRCNYLTRPSLFQYTSTRERLTANAADLFDVIARGVVTIQKPAEYALQDAAQAHSDLEGRKTTGSVILIP
jgi:NADPH:quinone reductase